MCDIRRLKEYKNIKCIKGGIKGYVGSSKKSEEEEKRIKGKQEEKYQRG